MKNKEITLENIEEFAIPLSTHILKWKFELEDERELYKEFKDQIIPLNDKASAFLWDFEFSQKFLFLDNSDYFKETDCIFADAKTREEVKKWLYQRGIKFDTKVIWTCSKNHAFVLTWKMIIKFWDGIFFASDEIIWDKTLNWVLNSHHEGVLYFSKDRIYDANTESKEIAKTNEILKDFKSKIPQISSSSKYISNPFRP
ncbi:hypothetical protein V9L05_05070 [Bernardetia sp. Wsw4-3y2]|uniref:hypothetical protein n=1 Tax=Bernardetia sp. Wsw4-3y2 TaxID=3127471 RepID=UPI0030D03065